MGLRGRIFPWRNLSWKKRNSVKGALDFLAFKKNSEKINLKKFFPLKVRTSIKTSFIHLFYSICDSGVNLYELGQN